MVRLTTLLKIAISGGYFPIKAGLSIYLPPTLTQEALHFAQSVYLCVLHDCQNVHVVFFLVSSAIGIGCAVFCGTYKLDCEVLVVQ